MATPKSTIGLKNVVYALLTEDSDSNLTYGDVVPVVGAIEATITPENADADVQYADDVEWDALYPDPTLTLALSMVSLPLTVQAAWLGNALDTNGVLIRSAADQPPYFALGFKSEKSDGTFRYVWLYKCRAKPITESYGTKEGENITRQTGDIEITAIKRTNDGKYQAVADEGENGFTPAKGETFLSSVYAPAASAGG